jgi:hypothetical protein
MSKLGLRLGLEDSSSQRDHKQNHNNRTLGRPTEPGHSHLLIHIKVQGIGVIIKVSSLISPEDLTFGSSIFLAFSPKEPFCFVGS